MKGLPKAKDAYGRALLDHLEGRPSFEIVERDDGRIDASIETSYYFATPALWAENERQGLRYVRGRVLDVGAGAGRISLHLQEKGHEVVAIDNSPLAVQVCKRRGVGDARVLPFTAVSKSLGVFDSVVMLGHNFGLFGSAKRASFLLKRLQGITSDDAVIVASSLDPHATDDPGHLSYQKRNRKRGRMPGQVRLRVRYHESATPWFDYLLVSPAEMRQLVDGSGWKVDRLFGTGPSYVAVIVKV